MLSGGSVVSWSATFAAKIVTSHDSPSAKSVSGSSVKRRRAARDRGRVGAARRAGDREPRAGDVHGLIEGDRDVRACGYAARAIRRRGQGTAGAVSVGQGWMVETVLRETASPAVKSLPLSSVSDAASGASQRRGRVRESAAADARPFEALRGGRRSPTRPTIDAALASRCKAQAAVAVSRSSCCETPCDGAGVHGADGVGVREQVVPPACARGIPAGMSTPKRRPGRSRSSPSRSRWRTGPTSR